MMKRIVAILLCLLPTAAVAEPHTLALRAVIPCTDGAVPMKDLSQGATYCLDSQVVFSQDDVVEAHRVTSRVGPAIRFKMSPEAARRFDAFTMENVGKRFGIVIDGELVSAPTIAERIWGGGGEIPLNRPAAELDSIAAGLVRGQRN